MADNVFWAGHAYSLRIGRHWQCFFGIGSSCEVRSINRTVLLSPGAAWRIPEVYAAVVQAREHLPDLWFSWSQRMCDQYCDHFVMKRAMPGNIFFEMGGSYLQPSGKVKRSAASERGFCGPDDWKMALD